MNIFKKLINWLIHLLGGYTREEYNKSEDSWFKIAKTINADYFEERDKYTAIEKTLRTAESYITIDSALGYTYDNVINESRQQTYYRLGKAVYPYAKHFITSDGKYICTVNVQEVDE